MLHLSPQCRYYLYNGYIHMRSGFDRLSGIVTSQMSLSPTDGSIFIFLNKNRNQVKLLLWEGDGFAIYHKRLEQGTYELPGVHDCSGRIAISSDQLQLILHGIKLSSVRKRKRYAQSVESCGLQPASAQYLH